jgi:hypothetical protein
MGGWECPSEKVPDRPDPASHRTSGMNSWWTELSDPDLLSCLVQRGLDAQLATQAVRSRRDPNGENVIEWLLRDD